MMATVPQVARPDYDIVIVCPTWACNCRCWYCYQDHANRHMPGDVLGAVEKFVTRNTPGRNWFWLEFFGGEPLLSLAAVRRLARHAQRECFAQGVPFLSGMTTNGVLLDADTLAGLVQVGVSHFQITLDGPPEFHDRQRYLASGGPTWERIWSALMGIRRSAARVKVILRVHYQVPLLNEALRLVEEYLNPNFATDGRFSVQFEHLQRLGGPNDERIPQPAAEERDAAVRQLRAALASEKMLVGLNSATYACYASKSSSVVVTPEGELAKCTVSFAPIGRLRPDGGVELNAEAVDEWSFRGAVCSQCPNSVETAPRDDQPGAARRLALPMASGR